MEYDSLYDRTPSRSPEHAPEHTPGKSAVQSLISQFMTAAVKRNANRVNGEPKEPKRQTQAGVEVVVPVLDRDAAAEYDRLPGHKTADKVLSSEADLKNEGDDLYEVRLKSGEVECFTSAQLTLLDHGFESLSAFLAGETASSTESSEFSDESEMEDSLQSRRPRRRKTTRDRQGLINSAVIPLSDDDDDDGDQRPLRRSRRTRQTSDSAPSEDKADSDDELDVISSGSRPGRRSRRLLSQMAITISDSSDDSGSRRRRKRKSVSSSMRNAKRVKTSSVREGTRRSERTRNQTTNMVELREDDIESVEVAARTTKYAGAREQFTKIPRGDSFRARHVQACFSCGDPQEDDQLGPLVFCQGCTYAYHQNCLGPRGQREHLVTKVNFGDFVLQCRFCIGVPKQKQEEKEKQKKEKEKENDELTEKEPKAPHHGYCSHCNEPGPFARPLRKKMTSRQEQRLREENAGVDPITNVDMSLVSQAGNVMFRCVECQRAWHMEHLPPKGRRQSTMIQESEVEETQDLKDQRFKEYSRSWKCIECAPMREIDTLVAWRPVDLDSFVPGSSYDQLEETAKEYLVKWRNKSYFKTEWMPGAWVYGRAAHGTRKAFRNSDKAVRPMMTSEDAIPEDYLQIEIVLDVMYSNVVSETTKEIDLARAKEVSRVFAKYKGLGYEDAVWEEPPKPQDTERWTSFQKAYEDWVGRKYMRVPRQPALRKHLVAVRSRNFATQLVKYKQPSILTGGTLMKYQLDGSNWMYYRWYQQKNAILADEMGLGKTIQVLSFIATLVQDHGCWPFLIVVPNSTVQNWRSEAKTWVPSLQVVTYFGSDAARKRAYQYEMFPEGRDAGLRAHIVVVSYESAVAEKSKLASIPWAGLVVDEGHRLKSSSNHLYGALEGLSFPFKVLLTGTPLQNNVRELFNLLQFCDPSQNAEQLEEQYSELTNEAVAELHDLIRPYFLRRTKAEVLTFLPPVAQIIVPVSMSVVQKKLYKAILAKEPRLEALFTKRGTTKKERYNLNNILLQLRKCLCHPFVYSRAIEERGLNETLLYRTLVEASSKLQLLEQLLPKLHERGHRILIFSQFLEFLDIIEDFLDGLGLMHVRFDGKNSALEKQKRINAFNAEDSPYFAFLLSTRSGGQGINLATADTVILMDPDFNPHQDMQAMSRSHRIGQKKKVLVFQLMTRNSAEEKIMQIGRKKLALDHVLIERMDADDGPGEDIEGILLHGADALFEDDTTDDIHYDAQSIDRLLDRSQIENTAVGSDRSVETQFSHARVWVNDAAAMKDDIGNADSMTPPNASTWDKLMEERERMAAEEARREAEAFGRGKRRRQEVNYAIPHSPSHKRAAADSDDEFHADDSEADSVIGSAEATPDRERAALHGDSAMARLYKRAQVPAVGTGPIMDGASDTPRRRCIACDEYHEVGYCRLKLAGVEHCGLCGLSHYGQGRTCPHLGSEVQVARMLGALKESTEPRALIEEATKYLRGVRGDLVRKKKAKAAKAAKEQGAQGNGVADVDLRPPPIPGTSRASASAPAPDGSQAPYPPSTSATLYSTPIPMPIRDATGPSPYPPDGQYFYSQPMPDQVSTAALQTRQGRAGRAQPQPVPATGEAS